MRTTGYLYTGAIQKQKSTKLRNDVTTASMLTKLILHTRIKSKMYAEFPLEKLACIHDFNGNCMHTVRNFGRSTMWIHEFKNKAGRPWVEFFRATQTDDGRRSSIRLGRFQTDVCRSATGLAARRNFTASEDEQFLEWWAPRQARIDAATSRASAAARAQRTADTLPGLTRAVSTVLEGLESGALTDGAAIWDQVDRLAKSLKAAGQFRPVTTPVKCSDAQ
jgi:hypothetical protein